jgi:hypothetical protein
MFLKLTDTYRLISLIDMVLTKNYPLYIYIYILSFLPLCHVTTISVQNSLFLIKISNKVLVYTFFVANKIYISVSFHITSLF